MPNDSELTAYEAATSLHHPSIPQFYDPNGLSGKAIAESIGWEGKVAWDIYLFYATGLEWKAEPPNPTARMHQLRRDWTDQEHLRVGDDLVKALYETASKLLEQGATSNQ